MLGCARATISSVGLEKTSFERIDACDVGLLIAPSAMGSSAAPRKTLSLDLEGPRAA